MGISDQVMTALLVAQLAAAAVALVRTGYFAFKTVQEAQFKRFAPYPTTSLSESGRQCRHKFASWLGISVTIIIVPWLVVLVGYAVISPPAPQDTREFTVLFSGPSGRPESIGAVEGFAACEAQAARHARAHGIFESSWDFQCCLAGSPSACEINAW